jgi:hypothetical protein
MGAVADNYPFDLTSVKNYLQVNGNQDDLLIELLFDAAKAAADTICQNPFGGAAGSGSGDATAAVIPADVKLWVLARVARGYARRAEGLTQDSLKDVGSVSWGDEDVKTLMRHRKNPGM